MDMKQQKMQFVIQSLITGDHTEKDVLHTCLKEFEIDLHIPKQIILIQMNPPSSLPAIPHFQETVLQFLKGTHLNLFTFHFPCKYCILTDTPTCKRLLPAFQQFAVEQAHLLKTAVGKSCELFQLDRSYLSAVLALQSISDSGQPFACFDSMSLEMLLQEFPMQSRDRYIHMIFGELSEEDLQFLKIYFEEDRSLTRTSRRLYMHKNTVQYQLKRIAQKSGYNPRHFHDSALLYLAMKLEQI